MAACPKTTTALGVLLALANLSAGPAAAQTRLEYAVKANYLVRFTAFVDWPADTYGRQDAPLVLCVAGRDPFGAVLTRAAEGKTAHGRSLRVVANVTGPTAMGCHLLYLGGGADPALTAAPPVAGRLTVSDAAAASRGGMIHFVLQSSRVRFHIDQGAAQRGRLSISSRLLALALTVEGA